MNCARYVGTTLTVVLSMIAFLSPIAMLVLPKLDIIQWRSDVDRPGECQPECEGLLISFAFKLLVLLIGALALFFRKVFVHILLYSLLLYTCHYSPMTRHFPVSYQVMRSLFYGDLFIWWLFFRKVFVHSLLYSLIGYTYHHSPMTKHFPISY